MEINWRYQNKHISNPDSVWSLIQCIEKDICFLYYQLSSYSYIMGDLSFSEYYNLPYWDYINYEFPLDKDQLCFIRNGCLIIILAMAWEQIDDAGSYINDKINTILSSLKDFEPANIEQKELHNIVTLTVNFAKKPNKELYSDIKEKSIWVHKEYIRGYYRKIVRNFDTNPYYNG